MDARDTLPTRTTFLELLNAAFQSGEKVHLLVDDNGLERAEGFIKAISANGENSVIELESGLKIELNKIAAANGIFLPEYATC